MIFIIFDIEIIFLYPWAVMYRQLDVFGLAEMIVFSIAVLVSFLYLVSNGALDWGPPERLAEPMPSLGVRSSTSTIRRVSRPEAIGGLAAGSTLEPEPEPDEEPVTVGAGDGIE